MPGNRTGAASDYPLVRMDGRRRWGMLLLLLALVGGWSLAGVVTARPASAHALLLSSDPADDARLATAPARVTLTFSEDISLKAGFARVLTADGTRADAGTASVSGPVVTIPLRSGLGDDGYLVSYRIISADSHPVAGSITFVVGSGRPVSAGSLAASAPDNPVVAVALPVARWLGFAGLALAVGIPVLLVLCWPGGWAEPRMRRLTAWGLAGLTVGTAATFLLQGPYAAGVGAGSLADPALLSATVDSEFGQVVLIRLVLALGLAAVLLPAWHEGRPPARPHLVAAGLLGLGVVVTTAAVGHPVAGSWPVLAVVVAAVHVGGMALWLGGLAGMLAGLLRTGEPAALAAVLPRFSRVAFAAVSALVVSGTVQAVREVGSAAALFGTAYGRILTVKLVLVLVILGAAGVSRVWVQQRMSPSRSRGAPRRVAVPVAAGGAGTEPGEDAEAAAAAATARAVAQDLPAFRRSVLVEFVVAVVVLVLSAVLVGAAPGTAVAGPQPLAASLPLQGSSGPKGSVQVAVDPARPGPNVLHLYLFGPGGQLIQPVQIAVTLTEPAEQIGPIDVKLQPGGPGHYLADAMTIPSAGTWTLTVNVRLDEFTAVTASTPFPVR